MLALSVLILSLLPMFGAKDFNVESIRGSFYIYQPKENMQVGKESKLMIVYCQYTDEYEMVKNQDLQESGENGIVDQGYGKVGYRMGALQQPDSFKETDPATFGAEFDRKKGLLFYAGYLWEIDK